MSASSPTSGRVETLVTACLSRISSQAIKREAFLACAVSLLGLCLLLFMGTRYVPGAVAILTGCFGVWFAMRRWRSAVPDAYAVAQQIDFRQGLADRISTAFFFRTAPAGNRRPVVEAQYSAAANAAAELHPAVVFPNHTPWTQRASVWLIATALVLFGLRVSVQSSLSFEPPLATLLLGSLFGYMPERPTGDLSQSALIDEEALPEPNAEEDGFSEEPVPEPKPRTTELPEERYQPEPDGPDSLPEVEGLITLPLDALEGEEAIEDALTSSDADDAGMDGEGADAEFPPSPADEWDDEAQSLLDKLKQAFSNMLETLDMASVDSSDSEQGQEQGSGTTEEASAAGNPADSGDMEEGPSSEAADASMEGGEPGETAGETASAGNTSGEDSSGDQSSGENASAAGTSDGSKELVEAEQLEVFGELEELYMQRAENIKGDVTIETRLAEQDASVPYNQRSTSHADRGGAISRDEIPAAFRTYIKNYFEALRKSPE